MKKNEGKGAIAVILIIVLLLIIAGLCYVIYDLYTNKLDSEAQITDLNGQVEKLNGKIEVYEEKLDQITKTISNKTEQGTEEGEEIVGDPKKIVCEATSADNAAAQGNPEKLIIREKDDKEIVFEYNSGYDFEKESKDRVVKGTAKKTGEAYVYTEKIEDIEYKIEFTFKDDECIKVQEYKNGEILGNINLWY